MTRILIIGITLLFSLGIKAQDNFGKFEEMKGVTSMVMTPKMFKLLGKIDLDSSDKEVKEYIKLIDNLEDIRMYMTEDSKISTSMKTEVSSYLTSRKLEELMRVKDDDKSVKFYYKPAANEDYVKEFLMFLDGDLDGQNRTVIIKISGNIDLKQISKLTKDLKFPGSEKLKELDDIKTN